MNSLSVAKDQRYLFPVIVQFLSRRSCIACPTAQPSSYELCVPEMRVSWGNNTFTEISSQRSQAKARGQKKLARLNFIRPRRNVGRGSNPSLIDFFPTIRYVQAKVLPGNLRRTVH